MAIRSRRCLMATTSPPENGKGVGIRLAIAGVDFGWGSAGKLAAILAALRMVVPGLHVTGYATRLGRRILSPGLVDRWSDCEAADVTSTGRVIARERNDAALVVLDPDLAVAIEANGCPVVYVDSLPYLWTEFDPVPKTVSAYCAQRSVPLPVSALSVLDEVENLHWVDPIVSPELAARGNAGGNGDDPVLLVNFGGLHSPQDEEEAAENYVALVLPALLEAARKLGVERVVIAGNMTSVEVPDSIRDGFELVCLQGDQRAFFKWLRKAHWIVTSPGLTTILEISALGRTAVLLPPQNLSQFHHSEFVRNAVGGGLTVDWPENLLAYGDVVAWQQSGGEIYALERIYGGIRDCRGNIAAVAPALTAGFAAALAEAGSRPSAFAPLARSPHGAAQVADRVIAVAAGQSARR